MPAAPREIRRLAFQILFQLDVRGAADLGDARTAIAADEDVSDKDLAKADNYLNELAGLDFAYKDVADLLDKIRKMREDG